MVLLNPSITLLSLLLTFSSLPSSSSAQTGPNTTAEVITEKPKFSPFKPSMAVIVGVLTATFSLTFLILLYARHCKRSGVAGGADQYQSSYFSAGRKDSGVDRAVVESLPVFRFGRTGRAECAVCLSRFERSEVLRLLPKCRHAFHVECVDTWLEAHSTCPLCRFRVDPEDVLLLHQNPDIETGNDNNTNRNDNAWFRRVSGRHSSAGERAFQLTETASFRRSLDSWHWKRLRNNNNNNNNNNDRRKDGMLLSERQARVRNARLGPHHQRWSDVQPSDLLYLRSEMIMSGASSSGLSLPTRQQACRGGASVVMGSRSASERFGNYSDRVGNDSRRRAGLVSRWKAWVSQRQRLVR